MNLEQLPRIETIHHQALAWGLDERHLELLEAVSSRLGWGAA